MRMSAAAGPTSRSTATAGEPARRAGLSPASAPRGILPVMRVPRPGLEAMVRSPPTAASRSRMLARP